MFFLIALVQPILSIQSEYTSTCEDYQEKIDAVFTWVNGSDPWFVEGLVASLSFEQNFNILYLPTH